MNNSGISRDPWHGQIGHQQQTGRRIEQAIGGVDQRGDRGLIPSDASVDDYIQGWIAFNLNSVVRVRGIEIHLQIQSQANLSVYGGLGVLMEAASLAFLDLQILRADSVIGYDGVAGFDDVLRCPAQAVREEGEGFLQPGVAGFALLEPSPKFYGRQATADLLLQGDTSRGSVHYALHVNGANLPTDAGEEDRQEVHYKAGIHAGANNTRAGFLADTVEFGSQFRLAERGKEQFLARRNDADAPAGYRFKLDEGVSELGNGSVENELRAGMGEQLLKRPPDQSAAQCSCPREGAQVFANLRRVDIHAADDLRPWLRGREFQGLQSDRAQAELCNSNLRP